MVSYGVVGVTVRIRDAVVLRESILLVRNVLKTTGAPSKGNNKRGFSREFSSRHIEILRSVLGCDQEHYASKYTHQVSSMCGLFHAIGAI